MRFVMEPRWEQTVMGLGAPAMEQAATVVAAGQKRRMPVSQDGSYGRAPGYARDRVHVERGRDRQGPFWDVGSDAMTPDGYNYPLGLELGTRPHTIVSHGDYPLRNRKTGQVFGRVVDHPGNDPMPWCRVSLGDLAGRVFR